MSNLSRAMLAYLRALRVVCRGGNGYNVVNRAMVLSALLQHEPLELRSRAYGMVGRLYDKWRAA